MSDSGTSTPNPNEASDHTDYRLRTTAGTSYDVSTHTLVPVNAPQTLTFETDSIMLSLAVRIRNFTGFPPSSPETSPYFQHPLHKSDQYSISFSFIPKSDIRGSDLIFGNDFDRPIRDRLPPGFNQAFRIVKWFIDPGLEGDVYADNPYLYGPALSSWNVLRIGHKVIDPLPSDSKTNGQQSWKMPNAESFHETVVEEGAEGTGEEVRGEASIPSDSAARKKFFLTESHRDLFTFEAGRLYQSDFGNPYLDFNDFSLKLPGFSLNVIRYIDSKTHELRYTLKNKTSGEIYCVVLFTLLFGDELKEAEREAEMGHEGRSPTPPLPKEVEKPAKAANGNGDEPPPNQDDLD
jgi:hypothetical protein